MNPRIITLLACATLAASPQLRADSGVWTTAGAGNWSDIANWNYGSGPIADGAGFTADFSTLDLSAATTVTLDTSRTIGRLLFADVTPSADWTIAPSGTTILTLDGNGTTPRINVSNRTAIISAILAGAGGLVVDGSGTLTLNTTNTITGGLLLDTARLNLGGAQTTINQLAMPGGTLTLTNGGLLVMNGYGSGSSTGWGSITNPVIVPAGTTGNIFVFGRGTFSSTVTVAGTLNLGVSYVRGDITGNWTGSTGLITTTNHSGGSDFRMNSTAGTFGFGTAEINLGNPGYVVTLYQAGNFGSGGQVVTIGAVSGYGHLRGGPTAGRTLTYLVGGKNIDTTLAGTIANSTGPVAITKQGTGAWTLAGVNPYTGRTLVTGGKLVGVTGGSIPNSASVTVTNAGLGVQVATANGQWITTNVLLAANAINSLTFDFGNSIVPSTTTPPLLINGNLTADGSNQVNIIAGAITTGTFPLLKYTNTLAGAGFATFGLVGLPPHVTATLADNPANKTIDLVVTAVNQPLSWATGSGTWDINTTANWKDLLGAATTYQEAVGNYGDSVLFEDSMSGSSPITVTLATAVKPGNVTVNSTKDYTLSGAGAITGVAGITKQGTGTLTLSTPNTFSGLISLNAGTIAFSTAANIGAATAPFTFNGGTLRYAAGNTTDLSTRTVTIGSSGGTIDIGANNVTFANAIGNNGTGSLFKSGSGTLTLNASPKYSGYTRIAQGTLALGPSASLSNITSIVVVGGAMLDASANGLQLNSIVGQLLGGAGTVTGTVTTANSTILTVGTNGITARLTLANDLNLSGGTYFFDVSTGARDLLVVDGAVALNSGTLKVTASGLTNGLYTLITAGFGFSGSVGNLVLDYSQAGKIAELVLSDANTLSLKISTAGGASIVWKGDGAMNFWDVDVTANWLNGAVPVNFINADKVTFDDTGSTTPAVSLQQIIQPGSVTVNSSLDYTFTDGTYAGNGKISGGTGLTKSGTGKLTILTGNNNSGPTLIQQGTIQLGDGSTAGSLGLGTVSNNAVLNIAAPATTTTTLTAVHGTGQVTVDGSGTALLAGDSTFTGGLTINSGIAQIGNGAASGTPGTGGITNSGSLLINRSGTIAIGGIQTGVAGGGTLIVSGPGVVSLAGGNTYQNNTYISNGVVKPTAANVFPFGDPTTGWLILDGGVLAAGVLDLNGFDQTVNALSGIGGTVNGRITNSGTTGTNSLTVGNDAAATTYNGLITDNATGAKTKLVKQGAGSMRLNGANTYAGGTYIAAGTLAIGPGGSLGTAEATVTNGATLSLVSAGSTSSFVGNNVVFKPGVVATFNSGNLANGYGGSVYGDANCTNLITGTFSPNAANLKQYQNFLGTVVVDSGVQVRWAAGSGLNNGGDNTTFLIAGTGSMYHRNTGTISLGALEGDGVLAGLSNADGTGTWVIGAKNVDCTFSGQINGVAPRGVNVQKVGTGMLTLSGTLNYDGTTTVSTGKLALASAAVLDNSPTITINSAGTLDVVGIGGTLTLGTLKAQTIAGSGLLTGNLAVGANSTVRPGDGIGKLTIGGSAALDGAVFMELNRTNTPATNDMLAATSFTATGTLTVTNLGPTLVTGDKFKLFSLPVSGFSSVLLPAANAAGTITYVWQDDLAVDGSIKLLSGFSITPTNLTYVLSGDMLEISWPQDHTGWTLQAQTNSLSVGISNNWFTVAGSTLTNRIYMPVNPNNGAVFYRMVYP